MIPREPTEAMVEAAEYAAVRWVSRGSWRELYGHIWRAMYDAAIEERNGDVPREVTATEHEILGRALRRSAKPLPAEQGHILTERIGELLDPPRDGVQPEPRDPCPVCGGPGTCTHYA